MDKTIEKLVKEMLDGYEDEELIIINFCNDKNESVWIIHNQ